MDLGLTGHVAVVVGSASGLGRAIADAFAAEGAHVARWDISPAAETVVDATDSAAVSRAAEQLGRVDHVVYAAAVGSGKFGFPFWSLTTSDWPRVVNVNLMGAVNVAHAFAPGLAEQRSGTLLFLASVAGQNGSQTDPPYSAAKAAVLNFTKCAAKDLAPFGVRVNALCPGMVQTPLNRAVWQTWADRQPPEARQDYETWAADKIAKLVPLGRWQTPEDVAAMAVFLASDRAANVTGQTVNVDGGYVMHW
jgi:2-hydroxycyclohexanecarboxyl-CoA dehydrogenase